MRNILIILFVCLWGIGGMNAQNLVSQQDEKGKYGFVNESGEYVIQPKYDDIGVEFTNGVASVKQKGKYVFIDEKGKEISKKSYSWVNYFDENGLCMVNNGGKVNENDEVTGGKFGYVDRAGKEVVPVKYNLILPFNHHGVACVNVGGYYNKEGDFLGGRYGFINIHGKELITPRYTRVGSFDNDGIAWVNTGGKENSKTGDFAGGKFGYVNDRGVEIVAPKYSFIGAFIDGIAWVNTGGKAFLRDKKLEKKMQDYEKLLKDVEKKSVKINNKVNAGLSSAAKDYKDVLNEYIAGGKDDAELASLYETMDDLIREETDRGEKMRRKRETLVFESTGGKRDVRQVEVSGGKFGFVDINGREITKIKYTQTANHFTEKRAWVQIGKKYGYIDDSGREITKIIYDEVAPEYKNNFAGVILKQRFGIVNHAGQEITEIKYLSVGDFDSGFTWVKQFPEKKGKNKQPAKYAFIDERGHLLTDFKYDMVHPEISDGVIGGYYDGGWCYINNQGKEITKNDFLDITPFDGGVAWAKRPDEQLDAALGNETRQSLTKSFQSVLSSLSSVEESWLKAKFRSLKEPLSESIEMMKRSALTVSAPGYYALIDKEGNQITGYDFSRVGKFSEGLAFVRKKPESGESVGSAGYLNRKGETVIPFNYVAGFPFKDGLAAVKNKENKWGFVNIEGKEIISCQYNSVTKSFKDGLAGVKIADHWGGINKNGEIVIPANLSLPVDVAAIAEKYYLPGGQNPLTVRQVTLYNIYQKNTRKRFSITSVIPEDMWDF